MSSRHVRLLLGLLLVAVFAAGPQPVLAQDCGLACESCGIVFLLEGRSWSPDGEFNMDCDWVLWGGCYECESQPLVSDDATPERILDTVRAVPLAGLEAVLEEYGDRLLLNASRNLVAVRGSSQCSAKALAAVAFLAPGKSRALEQFGVRRLEGFLVELEAIAQDE